MSIPDAFGSVGSSSSNNSSNNITNHNTNKATKLLKIKIIKCEDLAKKDFFGASDPYVRINLLRSDDTVIDSVYTKTKKKTLNPKWNAEFFFHVNVRTNKVLVEIFDENRLIKDDFLGKVDLLLDEIPMQGDIEDTGPKIYPLKQRSSKSKVRGTIEMYCIYLDEEPTGEHHPSSSSLDSDWEVVQNDDLPSGWESRYDSNGRIYYVNHNLRTTQWERPTSSSEPSNVTSASLSEVSTTTTQQSRISTESFEENGSWNNHEADSSEQDTASLDSIGTGERPQHNDQTPSSPASSTSEQPNSRPNSGLQVSTTAAVVATTGPATGLAAPGRQTTLPYDEALGPLPPGWSQQVAQTGRLFFIDHNNRITTWVDPRTNKPTPSPQSQTRHGGGESALKGDHKLSNTADIGPLPPGWEERVHRDGRIFFIDHNNKTTQWEDPRINNPKIAGPSVPYSRDYKQKHESFISNLPKPNNVPNKFEVKVSRGNVLEDSFRIISNVSRVDYLKTKLWIEFDCEEVLDYGGASREWFYLLSKEMFNPYYGLFEYSSADQYTLQIKPTSGRCNESHLAYFKFIGRVAGMAIYHGKLLDAFFIRPFYKMMLGREITLKDMESVDVQYYKSLKFLLENDIDNTNELFELYFTVNEDFLGVNEEKELKPNGSQIRVTNENKHEYINLIIDWRFVSRVKPQMNAFLEGFNEIIPKDLLKIFDANELELLMCGIGNVDVRDWKLNTVYKGGYHPNHIVIQWFWRVVLSFTNEMRSRLLQFVTGTSRVPMNGFKELYGSNGPQLFTIEKWGGPQNLPRSHTCFNRLDLPSYETYEDLKKKLVIAIEGSESFGGVD